MSSRNLDTDVSKFMSYVLRHAPHEAGLALDSEGWTSFADLKASVLGRFGITESDLLRIIEENPKRRFTLDGSRIRAAQGHSVAVDIGLAPLTPPAILYHGTSAESVAAIVETGLQKMARQHVHLSADAETAKIVARRRKGNIAILKIDAKRMHSDGGQFFLSENGVWLTNAVQPEYILPLTETET
ncbi:MAG: RNA 2'-phosphotransferase [Sinorhizobium fredii]|uniref:Probable RNA 2'-phosphotransferase n=1 Tax=Rhizobium fredii TaxID=380 RepID=A0A2A6M361_RHIFR|nr:RNA 2'-phosphotransferase [Sinorhizobium fredii]ASY69048.1 RNA:NAD 2'-phosphotransferase [Sinorhizobium fredii CCBAU 83666]MCG5477172.1 RNA 2'-phosphotransferase [Sinorhizobium fredii]PDT49214.1 RNA 2'-phosphotransferase [Sinorhizobium fredii]